METTTIELTVTNKLAEALSPYQHRLIEVLEAGLRVVQSNSNPKTAPKLEATDPLDAFWLAMADSGRVILPTPTSEPYIRQTPITLSGESLSDIVITQRGEL